MSYKLLGNSAFQNIMSEMLRQMCACLLNVSIARNPNLVEEIAMAAIGGSNKDTAVLNIFSDVEYNRSVITIVGTPENIGSSVQNACKAAFSEVDMSCHEGGHPRLGAVDLIPIHPLTEHTSLQTCGQVARDIAQKLSSQVPGTSFFLFGTADFPQNRGLVQRRKDVSWYSSSFQNSEWDYGSKPGPRYGLTGVGAIPYVMNCNVTINTSSLDIGQQIAKSLRASTAGGLPGVQAMAFPHEEAVEIACNVEAIYLEDIQDRQKSALSKSPDKGSLKSDQDHKSDISNTVSHYKRTDLVCSFGNCYHVASGTIVKRVEQMARTFGVATEKSTVVGFSPEEARKLAEVAISTGQREFWRTRSQRHM